MVRVPMADRMLPAVPRVPGPVADASPFPSADPAPPHSLSHSSTSAQTPQVAASREPVFMRVLTLAHQTVAGAWRDRVLGLAAEAGFWQLLSLPPLLLAILGTIGYIGDVLGADAVDSVRQSVLSAANDLLTPAVVDDVVRPTINEILTHGRPDVISIGFLLSLWTGSSAMATYVNTITIAYGQRELRSAVRSRLLALRLYLAQVTSGVILLPALVLGPGLLSRILNAEHHHSVGWLLKILFWPVVAIFSLAMLTSLYHLALPSRRPWRRAVPGALLAMVVWNVGSYLLRLYLETVFGHELIYGSVAAPVAALLFFYITALAVLLGAELNAAIDGVTKSVLVPAESQPPAPDAADAPMPRSRLRRRSRRRARVQ